MEYKSKIVFNADDLGLTKGFNRGIKLTQLSNKKQMAKI